MTTKDAMLDLTTTVVSTVSARDVAESIHAFAVKHGLIGHADAVSVEIDEDAIADLPQRASRFEQQSVIDVFRSRPIRLIVYDDKNRLVTVFTDKPVGIKLRKQLPTNIGSSVAIQYMASGGAEVRGSDSGLYSPQPYIIHAERFACGGSIFPANKMGAGTFGAIVRDVNGSLFGLSNNHVTGSCNYSEAGLPILAPAPLDVAAGRMDPFTIGRHHSLRPIHDGHPGNIDISQNVDAALFEIADAARVTSMQGNFYDTPSSVMPIPTGSRVEKVGRTTGHTIGTVVGVSVAAVDVTYEVREFNIRKIVFFPGETVYAVKSDGDNYFSMPGDSGSLVTYLDEKSARHAVGLVFAGNERNKLSFILPISMVLEQLNCSLVSGHGMS